MLQNNANELMKYISYHKFTLITTANQNVADSLIVGMYVGVSDNIL